MRRFLSIVFYLVAGSLLMTEAVMAFATLEPGLGKLTMLAMIAPFALIPLVLGALVSPGARLREIGIVLLASMAVAAFTVGMTLYVTLMPDTRRFMPPEALDRFGDYAAGAANLIALSGLGLLFFLRGRRSEAGEG